MIKTPRINSCLGRLRWFAAGAVAMLAIGNTLHAQISPSEFSRRGLFNEPPPPDSPEPLMPPRSDAEEAAAQATLVVFNENDPDSGELARFYAEKRGIPKDQVFGLRCSMAEEISRDEYDKSIADPLRWAFNEKKWWKVRVGSGGVQQVESNRIRFVALMRGMPLKIAQAENYSGDKQSGPPTLSTRNEASVDSELAALGYFTRIISGALNNRYYRSFTSIADANRPELLLVCRLDAPTPALVRQMITDAIAAEAIGLRGMAYIDARGLTEEGLREGDDWLLGAAKEARTAGMPVVLDNGAGMFPEGYPMRHAALYLGWYSEHIAGPFKRPGFRFVPGAIAVHIHSYSATSIRDLRRYWVAPLLAAGAAATIGNVYEPYLGLTPHLDIFTERLRSGFTFAESAYSSERVLSWMTTFVGDPLYRPFAIRDALTKPDNEWEAYRDGVAKWSADRAASETMLREAARRLRSGIIWEGLGLLELTVDQRDAAIEAFGKARETFTQPDDILRAAIHELIQLRAANREPDAIALAKKQSAAFPKSPAIEVIRMIVPAAFSATPGPSPKAR